MPTPTIDHPPEPDPKWITDGHGNAWLKCNRVPCELELIHGQARCEHPQCPRRRGKL